MAKRKTEKDYHNLAESGGFEWVGEQLPKNTHTKTWWECKKGHRWKVNYHVIQCGSHCPICNIDSQRKTKQDYYNVGKSIGISWVGVVLPKNVLLKTLWECRNGHMWSSTYSHIQQGHKCPTCSIKARKKVELDYNLLADSMNIKWISKKIPIDVKVISMWECKICGYRWETSYNSIQQGSGCPYCVKLARKTEKDYHELANMRGFKWIGKELPKNIRIKTKWKCKKGHEWRTTYNNISSGTGCPCCGGRVNGVLVSKPQIELNNLLYGSLNYPEGKYSVDVAIIRKSQKIAVEYDCYYWHKGKEKHDAKRDNNLIFRGWKIIHIKSGNLLPTRKQLTNAIGYLLKTDEKVRNVYLEDWRE